MKRAVVCCAVLLWLCAGARAQEAVPIVKTTDEGKPKAAVMSIVAEKGVDQSSVRLLNELVLEETGGTGRFGEVVGEQDIIAMLSLEEARAQIQGCVDETCMAEIGGALGVKYLIAGRVGLVGQQFVLSLKMIDTDLAKVEGRANMVTAPDETKLLTAAKLAVRQTILGEIPTPAQLEELRKVYVPPVVEEKTGPSPVATYGRWVALGLAAAAAGTAGALAGLAAADHSAMDDEVRGTPAWSDLKDSGETKAVAADAMFGVAGGMAAAAVVLFVLAVDWDDGGKAGGADAPASPGTRAGVTPLPGGGLITLGWRFDLGVTR